MSQRTNTGSFGANLAASLNAVADPVAGDSVGTPLRTMQSLLGHSSPEITRDIYLHAIPEEQRRAVESVERLVFGPKWTQGQAPAYSLSTRVN
jgi:hypothetical protein